MMTKTVENKQWIWRGACDIKPCMTVLIDNIPSLIEDTYMEKGRYVILRYEQDVDGVKVHRSTRRLLWTQMKVLVGDKISE